MEAGLELLSQAAGPSRKWACLGDMLEMGIEEERLHRALAAKISALGIGQVLLYGPRMASLADELRKNGFSGHVEHFETQSDLGAALLREAKPGDSILIKGSRGMRMEEVWKMLESHARSHWN